MIPFTMCCTQVPQSRIPLPRLRVCGSAVCLQFVCTVCVGIWEAWGCRLLEGGILCGTQNAFGLCGVALSWGGGGGGGEGIGRVRRRRLTG